MFTVYYSYQAHDLVFSETLVQWKGFDLSFQAAGLILDFPPFSYQLLKTSQSDLVSLTNQIAYSKLVPSWHGTRVTLTGRKSALVSFLILIP